MALARRDRSVRLSVLAGLAIIGAAAVLLFHQRLDPAVSAAVSALSSNGVRAAEHNPYGTNNDAGLVGRTIEYLSPADPAPNPWDPPPTLAHGTMRQIGVGWVRYWMSWSNIQAQNNPNPASWDWTVTERDIDAAIAQGLNVYVTIMTAPAWAAEDKNTYLWGGCWDSSGYRPDWAGCGVNYAQFDPPNPGLGHLQSHNFKYFVTEAVKKFGNKVKYWGFWNEPDVQFFWPPIETTGCNARHLQLVQKVLRPGREAALAANPSVVIVGPEDNSPGHLQALLSVERNGVPACGIPAGRMFDILSIHVYSFGPGPNGIPGGMDSFKNVLNQFDRRETWVTEAETSGGWFEGGLNAFKKRGWISKIFGYRMRTGPEPGETCQSTQGGQPQPGMIDRYRNPCYSAQVTTNFSAANPPPQHIAGTTGLSGHQDFVLLQNPHALQTDVWVRGYAANGTLYQTPVTMAPNSRSTVHIPSLVGSQSAGVTIFPTVPWLPIWAEHADRWNWTGATFHAGRAAQASGERSDTWYFAEGPSAGGFFIEDVTVYNPNDAPIQATWQYYGTNGALIAQPSHVIAARGHVKLYTHTVGSFGDHSTVVSGGWWEPNGPGPDHLRPAPITAERTITWQADNDGHAGRGVAFPSPTWYFAEGHQGGGWSTYLLAFNPSNRAAQVQVTFMTAGGPVLGPVETVGSNQRVNLAIPGWLNGEFGIAVRSQGPDQVPIVVERAMYRNWDVGTITEGVTSPSQRWLFAEGSTEGNHDFIPFFLLANPSNVAASVEMTYRRQDGLVVTTPVITVGAGQRVTVDPWNVPALQNHAFSTEARVVGPMPVPPGIIAERVMYWGGLIGGHVVMGMP